MSRRTGVELKDTGVRDENGIEPIPSFSSPVKAAIQPNGISHDVTQSADDTMDIVESKAHKYQTMCQYVQSLIPCWYRYDTGAVRVGEEHSKRQDQPSATCDFPHQNTSQLIT